MSDLNGNHSCVETLLESQVLVEVRPGLGWSNLDGVKLENPTDKTIYFLIIDGAEHGEIV